MLGPGGTAGGPRPHNAPSNGSKDPPGVWRHRWYPAVGARAPPCVGARVCAGVREAPRGRDCLAQVPGRRRRGGACAPPPSVR